MTASFGDFYDHIVKAEDHWKRAEDLETRARSMRGAGHVSHKIIAAKLRRDAKTLTAAVKDMPEGDKIQAICWAECKRMDAEVLQTIAGTLAVKNGCGVEDILSLSLPEFVRLCRTEKPPKGFKKTKKKGTKRPSTKAPKQFSKAWYKWIIANWHYRQSNWKREKASIIEKLLGDGVRQNSTISGYLNPYVYRRPTKEEYDQAETEQGAAIDELDYRNFK